MKGVGKGEGREEFSKDAVLVKATHYYNGSRLSVALTDAWPLIGTLYITYTHSTNVVSSILTPRSDYSRYLG